MIQIFWAAWLLFSVVLFAGPFRRHIELFQIAGPLYQKLILVILPALLLVAWGYHWVRLRGLARYELRLVVGVFGAVCLLYAPRASVACGAIALSAVALGGLLTSRLKLDVPAAVKAAIGFGVFMCALFPLGLAHLFAWPVLVAVTALPLIFGRNHLPTLYRGMVEAERAWSEDETVQSPLISFSVFFGLVFAALCAISAVTPVVNGDGVMFHLPLVRSFIAAGGFTTPEVLLYAYYPQGVESLMVMAQLLGGDRGPQLIPAVFFGITLMLLFGIARRSGASRGGAITGVVLAASIPFVHWSGSVLKNDIALAAFQLAALECVLAWRESGHFRWIAISAWLGGMAFMVKYVALFGTVPLAVLWIVAIWKQPRRVRAAALVLVVFSGFGSWFAVRTWLLAGNPVYPASMASGATSFRDPQQAPNLAIRYVETVRMMHFDGKPMFESPTSSPAGMAFILLAPVWFLGGRPRTRAWWVCLFFAVAYVLYWRYVLHALRYALPAFALLALLLGERLPSVRVRFRTAALACVLVFSLVVTIVIEMYPAQAPLFTHRIDGSEFLTRSLPPFGAVHYIAEHGSRDDWVLSIGAWARGYSPNPDRFDLVYRNNRAYQRDDVISNLPRHPFRWVILPEIADRNGLATALTKQRQASRVYADQWFSVYQIPGDLSTPRR